ncbi:MAG: hypothetical protein K1Y36_22135 [Blastocatellia bacterium]|nr:hypothetical protein [Blastocatellia bacterium]
MRDKEISQLTKFGNYFESEKFPGFILCFCQNLSQQPWIRLNLGQNNFFHSSVEKIPGPNSVIIARFGEIIPEQIGKQWGIRRCKVEFHHDTGSQTTYQMVVMPKQKINFGFTPQALRDFPMECL